MRKWKHTINLSSWYHDDSIDIGTKGVKLAEICLILSIKHFKGDYEILDIIEAFNNITDVDSYNVDESMTKTEEFDEWMNQLYNWADKKDVWIITN